MPSDPQGGSLLSHDASYLPATDQIPTGENVLAHLRSIERLVGQSLGSWESPRFWLHNRRWHRVAYQRRIALTPFDERTVQPCGPSVLLPARDLSAGGLSFRHPEPLPYRLVAVTFPPDEGLEGSLLVRLTWCRFTRDGSYLSGGRFVGMVAAVGAEAFIQSGSEVDSVRS